MSRILNGNPYAVLDKQVGYKEALEVVANAENAGTRLSARELIAVLFDHKRDLVDRDLERVLDVQCIACGGTKSISRQQHNPITGQWETYLADCQECEE